MIVEVSQHGIAVQILLKIFCFQHLVVGPSKKKKMPVFSCALLMRMYMNQTDILMFFGLVFWYLFCFLASLISLGVFTLSPHHLLGSVSLTDFSWDGQWLRPCSSSSRRGGMSAETGGAEEAKITFVYVCVCMVLAGREIPEFAQTYL